MLKISQRNLKLTDTTANVISEGKIVEVEPSSEIYFHNFNYAQAVNNKSLSAAQTRKSYIRSASIGNGIDKV